MSAQTNRVTRRINSRTQRAMSADQALTRAQSRRIAKIDAAIDAGREARIQKNMNGSVKLAHADGTVTPEGTHYYGKLEVAPPTIFPYEQPLVGH